MKENRPFDDDHLTRLNLLSGKDTHSDLLFHDFQFVRKELPQFLIFESSIPIDIFVFFETLINFDKPIQLPLPSLVKQVIFVMH